MSELLDHSSAIVDAWTAPGGPAPGAPDGPTNRITNELSVLGDGIAMVESFSHVVAFRTDDGLVLFDASAQFTAEGVVRSLRGWAGDPVHTLVYTHGHVDHVGGSGHLVADGRQRGHPDPRVVGHENIPARFDRYRRTNGWNLAINARQFGPGFGGTSGGGDGGGRTIGGGARFLPDDTVPCTDTYGDRLELRIGDLEVRLFHGRGETDDHTWAWIPEHRAVCTGDFVLWVFPNAGNPQKVQRYPGEWAHVLRQMQALEPELLLPAHGLPVVGRDRVATVLDDLATALEHLVDDVVGLMNDGATLDDILHDVHVDPTELAKPWMRPVYDEPEFVVRNIWRLYGGWWDGNPARLKPPPDIAVATELASLAGGVDLLVARANELSESGDHRLACHLVELAVGAAPDDSGVHRARAAIYAARAATETSLMAQGVYKQVARRSAKVSEPGA